MQSVLLTLMMQIMALWNYNNIIIIISNNTSYLTHPTDEKLHSITTCNKGNKSSEADSFRNIKMKYHTHLKMAM
jgi:hypothetical protein